MDYNGPSRRAFVKILGSCGSNQKWLDDYIGQCCDAIIYDELNNAHIDSSVLYPPLPKRQSVRLQSIKELKAKGEPMILTLEQLKELYHE